jgi:hypothetical protein
MGGCLPSAGATFMSWGSGSLPESLPRFFLASQLYQLSLSTTSHLCKWLQPFPHIPCLAFLARLFSKIFNLIPLKNKGTFHLSIRSTKNPQA